MMHRCGMLILLALSLVPGLCEAADVVEQHLEQIEKNLEVTRYQDLARIQTDSHNRLTTFLSDGCSGGLSDGWRFLARTLPAFKQKFGDKPPYEGCCVEHDRAYWRGETDHGYAKRLAADKALQRCVIEFGKAHREEFARGFHLTPQAIETNFNIVAALMYRAVRVGGLPCTAFPWRWGYGWPPCKARDE